MRANRIVYVVLVFVAIRASAQRSNVEMNAIRANEGFRRAMLNTQAWLREADPSSKLIPRNLRESRHFWNAWDAAADNYAFMTLTAAMLDTTLLSTTMQLMLDQEQALTSRVGRLPDAYAFDKKGFLKDELDMGQVIFGSAEYMKDGLIPIAEWMGTSAWSARLLGILDDLEKEVSVVKEMDQHRFGKSAVVEVNGDLLQVLCRMYWFTGNKAYLDRAIIIGDHYLLEGNLPTAALEYLRIRDHGCEIIGGLTELYFAVHYARPDKKKQYRGPVHAMMDRILEVGRNAHGLFYNAVNPQTGAVIDSAIADTWGYTMNSYHTIYLLDNKTAYKDAVMKALSNLSHYRNYDWERGSSDGYADAVESALNLYNRFPQEDVAAWIDSEIGVMWAKQQPSGIIEGWHGDGNFTRTTLMYSLWKTQGTILRPWRKDVFYGAERTGDVVTISISSPKSWQGRLEFDKARHRLVMHMPLDYPRINQFPEWFTADDDAEYSVKDLATGAVKIFPGTSLQAGIPLDVAGGKKLLLEVSKVK